MRQTDGKYTGYQDGDLLMCVDCGSKAQRADWPGEGGICASASNGDAVCDACEDARAALTPPPALCKNCGKDESHHTLVTLRGEELHVCPRSVS